ncbi:MAG TPA: phage tail family protein [Bacillota bacterium]|nr:phage tail family protein [Bacillota bacterium]
MQKIRYINPRGEVVEVSPVVPPYIFESVSGIGAVDVTSNIQTPAGMDGALYYGLRLNDREVTLNLHVYGDERRSMYENRSKLIRILGSALNRSGEKGKLFYENDYGRWWIPAVVRQGPRENGRRLRNYFPMQIVFYCPDPAWRTETATVNRLAYLSGGFKFPLNIPAVNQLTPGIRFGSRGYVATIVNDGDVQAPIHVEITGTATRPRIELVKTGEFLAVNRELAAGDRLTISTERGAKLATIVRATGTIENAVGAIDPQSTWFQLQPGPNELSYSSGDDTTTATVIIRTFSRFGGV